MKVWAPNATRVDLVTDEETTPMQPAEGGWWTTTPLPAGARYRFQVDGNGPFPDPRSAWQPDGPHGSSVVIDHSTFPWRKTTFNPVPLDRAVIYELHVGTFTPEGTYAAAGDKLESLRDLGITHIELMPIATFPGSRGWGYDGVFLYAPHPAYGSPDDLKAFIQRAHDLGLAVLLDVVYNHLGPDGNYLSCFGPYFTDRFKTPWGDAVNFDGAHSDEVRAFFIENALMWLRDYRFDGLRLDAVHAIIDESAIHILEALAERVAELSAVLNRSLVLIAESDMNNPRLVRDSAHGGYGLDAHWEDDFHHALHAFLTGEQDGYYADFGSLGDLAKAIRQAYVFDGQHSGFRKRAHGRPPIGVSPHQLVVFAQNHDQIGNRALGERLSQLLDADGLKAAAALTLLSPFVPMLFQGEEWGASTPFQYFTDHNEELGRLVTEGRRREFAAFKAHAGEIPDPQAIETFDRSRLRWTEIEDPSHREILEWHRSLIALRRTIPPDAAANVAFDEADRWLALRRGPVLAVFNFADTAREVPLPEGNWRPGISGDSVKGCSVFPPKSTTLFTES
jgi:malto-oligosyltrehalose trehalohydrolase